MTGLLDQRSGEDRREGEPLLERARLSLSTVAAIVVFITGLFFTYFASVNTVNARVSVLETQRQYDNQRLERIEQKVDRLLERREP